MASARSELIVDADGHVCEPADLWTSRLPAHLRERGIRLRWNPDTGYDEAYVEDRLLSDRGLVGLGNAGTSFADLGRGIHYEDINRAGFDPRERIRVLDAEGIDISVLYPGLALSLGAIQDRELAIASCRVYNDWMAEYCSADPSRLVGVAALPLQDPQAAAVEARRAVNELGLRGAFARPNAHNGVALHDLAYTPVWEALDVPITFHPAGLWDMPGASQAMMIWASDFPHSDAKYPGVVDELREHTEDMPADARAKLFGLNALRLYGIEKSRKHEKTKSRNQKL